MILHDVFWPINGQKWQKLVFLYQKWPVFSERKAKNFENYIKNRLKPSPLYTETK